ncbi:MAG: hypothetical protein LBG19_06120 [Prevotellaceae bacterium]|jgi:adenine-specific DNA-methyltransferase|nr:hypothetical protein [Prevotellaceae bacterium]
MAVISNITVTSNTIEKIYSKKTSLAHRKKYAQFFTPYPLADLMVKWLLGNDNLRTILEPAFGLGIFSRIILAQKNDIDIKGFEVDKAIYADAKSLFEG